MTVRPILFSGPMVRALLEGRKTQTRRVLKPQIETFEVAPGKECDIDICWDVDDGRGRIWKGSNGTGVLTLQTVPYAPGDVLWVRETWATTINAAGQNDWPARPHIALPPDLVDRSAIWAADGDWDWCDGDGFQSGKSYWKPSIHMPRKYSRLTLEVTGVKVERLQDISEEDAIAEGVCQFCEDSDHPGMWDGLSPDDRNTLVRLTYGSAVQAYRHLWETINGADSWEANPWIVAPEFAVRKINVDAYLQSREAA